MLIFLTPVANWANLRSAHSLSAWRSGGAPLPPNSTLVLNILVTGHRPRASAVLSAIVAVWALDSDKTWAFAVISPAIAVDYCAWISSVSGMFMEISGWEKHVGELRSSDLVEVFHQWTIFIFTEHIPPRNKAFSALTFNKTKPRD